MNTALIPAPEQQLAAPAPTRLGSRGIVVTNVDELFTFAETVAMSGLAPKGLEKPQAVFVAVQMGLELGLSPMAALQNVAVINGRPAVWGDAQLAVCRASGEMETFEEWFEAGGEKLPRNPSVYTDDTTAVCRVKRRNGECVEVGFSVADAKRSQLWGKAGPWQQYPFRMLKARARSYALRDAFGDTLKGFRSAEEVQDEDFRDVTPAAPPSAGEASKLFKQPPALPAVTPVAEMLSGKPAPTIPAETSAPVVEAKPAPQARATRPAAAPAKPAVIPADDGEPTPLQRVKDLLERDGIEWIRLNPIFIRNDLSQVEFATPEEAPTDILNHTIKYWPKFVQLVKGGSK